MNSFISEYGGTKKYSLEKGSKVDFFENNHKFDPKCNQGFIEEIDLNSDEVTIRTVDGKILKNVSIFRVFL